MASAISHGWSVFIDGLPKLTIHLVDMKGHRFCFEKTLKVKLKNSACRSGTCCRCSAHIAEDIGDTANRFGCTADRCNLKDALG